MTTDIVSLADLQTKIPPSICINEAIFRGNPSEMVLEMVRSDLPLSTREALKVLTETFRKSGKIDIELPWHLEDEAFLAALFVSALLELEIAKPAYLA